MIRETQLSRTLRCGAKRVARPLEGSSDGRWTMIIAKIETFALRIPFKKGIKSDDRPRLRPPWRSITPHKPTHGKLQQFS